MRRIPLLETLIFVHYFLCRVYPDALHMGMGNHPGGFGHQGFGHQQPGFGIPGMQRRMPGSWIGSLIGICCCIIITIPAAILIYQGFQRFQTASEDFHKKNEFFLTPNIPTRSTGRYFWNQDANGTTPTTTLT